jgi:hypothetical protein
MERAQPAPSTRASTRPHAPPTAPPNPPTPPHTPQVDVEGYEPQALRSAARLLNSGRVPDMLLEYSPGIPERRRTWAEIRPFPAMLLALKALKYDIVNVEAGRRGPELLNWTSPLDEFREVTVREGGGAGAGGGWGMGDWWWWWLRAEAWGGGRGRESRVMPEHAGRANCIAPGLSRAPPSTHPHTPFLLLPLFCRWATCATTWRTCWPWRRSSWAARCPRSCRSRCAGPPPPLHAPAAARRGALLRHCFGPARCTTSRHDRPLRTPPSPCPHAATHPLQVGKWEFCNSIPEDLHPKSFRSQFSHNTNIWISKGSKHMRKGLPVGVGRRSSRPGVLLLPWRLCMRPPGPPAAAAGRTAAPALLWASRRGVEALWGAGGTLVACLCSPG